MIRFERKVIFGGCAERIRDLKQDLGRYRKTGGAERYFFSAIFADEEHIHIKV